MTESDPQRTSAPADRLQNARDSPLTDLRQFDILEFGLAGGDRNAIRSSEATWFHHASRRRGGVAAGRAGAAGAWQPTILL